MEERPAFIALARVGGTRDAVAFPPGTGIAHTFLNNTEAEVRLLVVGERRPENRIF